MESKRRTFVIMPFGTKKGPDGTDINFDTIYKDLLAPAIEAAGLAPHRADADRRGGSIHADMFQDLLLSEFVVADLTIDNPNVWYELGVRHALRARGAVLTHAKLKTLPFDIAGQRVQPYTLNNGAPDAQSLAADRTELTRAIKETLGAWRGRKASPVYDQIQSLQEPDWKTLKVGGAREFWEALDEWQSRVTVAQRNQRPGDILLYADETPNSVLELEALRTAASALQKLKHFHYALKIIQRAIKIDPDDVRARQIEGILLGRLGRYAEAKEALRRLSVKTKDGETLGLLARTYKDEWMQVWNTHEKRKTDPVAAADDTDQALHNAAAAYVEAFRSAPANYYPGINALTLGRLWEHVTKRPSALPLNELAGGVAWAVEATPDGDKDYWAVVTRGEQALVEDQKESALEGYRAAAALAVSSRDRFALDSSSGQLDFLAELKFRTDIVAAAAEILDRSEKQLVALEDADRLRRASRPDGGAPPAQPEPERVVVFSGHMIDDPKTRGDGTDKPARFPAAKADAAAARIREALDEIGARAGDLGLCGGACGGDLLFAEECLRRGMRVELRLAEPETDFLRHSVTFADPDRRWVRAFKTVKAHPDTTVFVMPDELGPAPEGVSVHDRCNRWMLYTGLSHGLARASFVTLWDGQPGDGPGGTQHMVQLVNELTGEQPIIIDPATL